MLAFSGTVETTCGEIQDQYTTGATSCCDVAGNRTFPRTIQLETEFALLHADGYTPSTFTLPTQPHEIRWDVTNATAFIQIPLANVNDFMSSLASVNYNYWFELYSTSKATRKIQIFLKPERDTSNYLALYSGTVYYMA